MASVQDVINQAYTKVNGEFDSLTESSDDFKTYLNVMNQVLQQWADTPYVKWQTLFNMNFTLATPVTSGVLVYAIPNLTDVDFGNTPYDSVYFVDGSGNVVDTYKITDQPLFDATTDTKVCAIVSDGLHLKQTPTNIIGTTIRLPAYGRPVTYTAATQTVVIDSISWLITSMAAFICASSPVPFIARNADRYEKEAAVYMKTMRANNKKAQHLIIKRLGNRGVRYTWADVINSNTLSIRDL